MPWDRAVKQDFFKKGPGRHGKGPEKAHSKPVTKSNSDVLDLEALSLQLQDISWVQLHALLFIPKSSSKLALWPEIPSKLCVQDWL